MKRRLEKIRSSACRTFALGRVTQSVCSSSRVRLIPFTILLGWAGVVSAQPGPWISNGPEGGFVLSVAVDPLTPTTLYAVTGGGVFKSGDGGLSWGSSNAGLTDTSVSTVAIDPVTPSTLYVGTEDGVFKSTDGGASWNASSTGLFGARIRALAIDPLTPTTLYAGAAFGGVNMFKSTDGGGSWSASNSGLTSFLVVALAIDPLTPSTLYAGTFDGMFTSTNGGASWAASNTGLTNTNVQALAVDPLTPTLSMRARPAGHSRVRTAVGAGVQSARASPTQMSGRWRLIRKRRPLSTPAETWASSRAQTQLAAGVPATPG